jgi:CBS domain containing-hemolysin-like protein
VVRERTGIPVPEGRYETVAGFVVERLGRLPEEGESVTIEGWRLTVAEVDGRRVDRLRATPVPADTDEDDDRTDDDARLTGATAFRAEPEVAQA